MATGRKTVVVGQVIDPVAWGNPLWDQSIQEFASDADRTAQFPVAQRRPGVVTWLDDAKRLDVWDGAAWRRVPYAVALSAVTGGTGDWSVNLPAGMFAVAPQAVATVRTINQIAITVITGTTTAVVTGRAWFWSSGAWATTAGFTVDVIAASL